MSKVRISSLDILRGVAALSVFLYHITFGYDNGMDTISNDRFYFIFGKYGVHLFFIISGFVIFMTIEKLNNTRKFFINRFTRLYPTYWVCIFLTILFSSFIKNNFDQFTLKQILVNLSMFQRWMKVPNIDGVYWSLGVELVFYFYIGLIFYFKLNKKIIFIGTILLIFSFISTVLEFKYVKGLRNLLILNYWPLFFSGILFFLLKNNRIEKLKASLLLILSFFLEIFILNKDTNDSIYSLLLVLLLIYFSFTVLVIFEVKLPIKLNVLTFFGLISYPLYLLHQEIGYTFLRKLRIFNFPQIIEILILLLISIILSVIVHIIIEKKTSSYLRDLFLSEFVKTKKND